MQEKEVKEIYASVIYPLHENSSCQSKKKTAIVGVHQTNCINNTTSN